MCVECVNHNFIHCFCLCVQWFVFIGAFKSFYSNTRKAYCRSMKMKGLLFGVIGASLSEHHIDWLLRSETPKKQQLLHDKAATRKRRREAESPDQRGSGRLERQKEYQRAYRRRRRKAVAATEQTVK